MGEVREKGKRLADETCRRPGKGAYKLGGREGAVQDEVGWSLKQGQGQEHLGERMLRLGRDI